jgi:hypothetical protein
MECYERKTSVKAPKWARLAFMDDGGQIFLPAVLLASEMEVFLMLGWDGTPVLELDGHLYAPSDWMVCEAKDPEAKRIIAKAAREVRCAHRQGAPHQGLGY